MNVIVRFAAYIYFSLGILMANTLYSMVEQQHLSILEARIRAQNVTKIYCAICQKRHKKNAQFEFVNPLNMRLLFLAINFHFVETHMRIKQGKYPNIYYLRCHLCDYQKTYNPYNPVDDYKDMHEHAKIHTLYNLEDRDNLLIKQCKITLDASLCKILEVPSDNTISIVDMSDNCQSEEEIIENWLNNPPMQQKNHYSIHDLLWANSVITQDSP